MNGFTLNVLFTTIQAVQTPLLLMMSLYSKQFILIPSRESRSPFVVILHFGEVWVGLKLPRSFSSLVFFFWNVSKFSNGQATPGISGNDSEPQILIPPIKRRPQTKPKQNCQKASSSGGHSVSIACGISWFLGNKLILNSIWITCIKWEDPILE